MAQWADEIKLIQNVSDETNENGFCIEEKGTARTVFCNLKSIGTTEFYKSQQAGYKAEYKAEVHSFDFENEEFAEINGRRLKIIKSYVVNDTDITELTLGTLNAGGE